MVEKQFTEIEKNDIEHKAVCVSFNDPEGGKRLRVSYLSENNKIQHEKDVYILSEAISLYISDYRKNGGNDAELLRGVVNNLEQNFISIEDKSTRGHGY